MSDRLLRIASVLALIGLALMMWGVLVPTPLPVLVGLSIGQAVGTLSFVLFLVVVAADLGLKRKLRRSAESAPSPRDGNDEH